DLNLTEASQTTNGQKVTLTGHDRLSNKLFINKIKTFETFENEKLAFVTNIKEDRLNLIDKVLSIEKVSNFILENLGDYPHKKLLASQLDIDKEPVYGIDFLSKFIRPYPTNFNYALKLL